MLLPQYYRADVAVNAQSSMRYHPLPSYSYQATVPAPLILCYHAYNIAGDAYHNNDHVALAADLELLAEREIQVVSLETIVADHVVGHQHDTLRVAITFDDGTNFDWQPLHHHQHGPQPGFATILRRSGIAVACASFVIASPAARASMQRTELAGHAWLTDDWWRDANRSGLLSIENHGWDHVHPSLATVRQRDNVKGDFAAVADAADLRAQIVDAQGYIARVAGRAPRYFAYPFGHYTASQVEWFEQQREHHGLAAAFTTDGRAVAPGDSVWALPRLVCGHHWRSSAALSEWLGGTGS